MISFLLGILVGALSTAKIKTIDYQVIKSQKKALSIFFNAFAYNYWYLFLIWLFGFISVGFILTYFTIFLKGFSFGTIGFLLLKSQGIPSIGDFIKLTFSDVFILLPILLYLTYKSISKNLDQKSIFQDSLNGYLNNLIVVTIGIVIYAAVITVMNNFIKI